MTRTSGAQIGCQRPSRFWGLGCPKIYHEAEDTLVKDDVDPGAPLNPLTGRLAQVFATSFALGDRGCMNGLNRAG
ncbi:hypothetical protein, partial [Thiolapillus sp.]|uniref:hypothetical protein n=1 Tax=Thiolapillus sp. TaxID=2017437 RepID=UPI003AF4FBA6